MRFSSLCFAAAVFNAYPSLWLSGGANGGGLMIGVGAVAASTEKDASCSASSSSEPMTIPPYVSPKLMLDGIITTEFDGDNNSSNSISGTPLTDVYGCCTAEGDGVVSLFSKDPNVVRLKRPLIGKMPQMSKDQTLAVLKDAETAWDGGRGMWPQMSLRQRVDAITNLLNDLETNQREVMVRALMWEIGKNRKDAEAEVDRTIAFGRQVMKALEDEEFSGSWQSIGSTMAFVRRAALGVVLCLGPMNYPLNETYATLIPALLMGNVVLMKIPTVGGLVHLLTMEAFKKALPKGAMNFVSGRGRDSMPVLMETGKIDVLAFIGGSGAADDLIHQHPHPHRLKVFLQLEGKNMGIFLPDIFEKAPKSELSKAMDQAVLGALSFNGQRCTALKLFFVPKAHGEMFAHLLTLRVEALNVGLPWQTWDNDATADAESAKYSDVTPLPNSKRTDLMRRLIDDAVSKGAKIMNRRGGEIIGGAESTLMVPAVLYPVTPDMDIYYEEQFGPVIPIATYESLDTVRDYGQYGFTAQQVSLFLGEEGTADAASILDQFSTVFGKININSQCGRSPDTLPFSGRRSSAMGVMSVKDALREFSVPTVLSYKDSPENTPIVQDIELKSTFLQPLM